MKVAITGATGLIGSALAPVLTANGHEIVRLSRSGAAGFVRWDPARTEIHSSAFANSDAIVHLAGANIAGGRWRPERRREITDSRVLGTRAVIDAIAHLTKRPRLLICASGTGFYGDTGETIADETSPNGSGFIADLCEQWEGEAVRAGALGVRVVTLRFAPVLTPQGGILAKMLPIYRLGLGGRIASGTQWMGWIALDDAISAIQHVLAHETLAGPVNVTAPGTVRSKDFSATLARALRRPALLPVPAFVLRIAFGQMADEALLTSLRVAPRRLLESGFQFRYPELDGALRHVIGR